MFQIEIRDNPGLKSFIRNITELGFTGLMWGLWVYLFLPVLNIVLWMLGVKYFHQAVIAQFGYKELLALLDKMGWTVLAVFLILRLWGYYNYLRFGRRNRRIHVPQFTDDQMAEHFRIPLEDVRSMQAKKEINLHSYDNMDRFLYHDLESDDLQRTLTN